MNNIYLKQDVDLVLTKKTIGWLIDENNTFVKVFDPVRFTGYQRKIDETHGKKIVDYIKKYKGSFLLPSAIICACDNYSEDAKLAIVDGQHRIWAFRMLKNDNYDIYLEIKDLELPIIVLNNASLTTEIDTFININKKGKKVDTSLAYVLKSKINEAVEQDSTMPKSEYIAVETARYLSVERMNDYWFDKILFEGNVKKSDSFISLNMFVTSARVLVTTLKLKGLINLDWNTDVDVTTSKEIFADLILHIWSKVFQKWPKLYCASIEEKQIIQGSIGFAAITRVINKAIKTRDFENISQLKEFVTKLIFSINIDETKWLKNGIYSKYSSGSGIKIVADELFSSVKGDF